MTIAAHHHLAFVLHRATLEAIGGRTYRRGVQYADEGRVKQLEASRRRLRASVRGSRSVPYVVRFWLHQGSLGYACDCPAAQDGALCKHCIAVAIAWLGTTFKPTQDESDAEDALLEEVVERARRDAGFRARLRVELEQLDRRDE